MTVRPAVPDDAPAVVALRAVVYPYLVRGAAATRRVIAGSGRVGHAAYVAEAGDRAIGWMSACRSGSDAAVGEISLLHVHPDHRRRGVGSALLDAAVAHLRTLGVDRLRAWVQAGSLDYARRRGFRPSRQVRYSGLPLRPPPAQPTSPPGVRLEPLAGFEPGEFHAAYVAAASDEPGDVPADTTDFDRWRADVWDDPGLDPTVSVVAVVHGAVASFTLVQVDGERMWSDMTATVPAYRGRGLALLAKRAALSRAAESGITMAYTANDESNAPMLAVNTRLGYRPVGAQWSCLAELISVAQA
ncbi:MAG TPA: GNAT family N-acetyltransferase [Micromonosporaceae bacterium]